MGVCVCVRQRLGSHSLDLTFKNSSGSLKFFFPSTQLCFGFCVFTGNFLLLSLSQFCTCGYVNHWRFHENSWGCWRHFPLSLGSKNFFPQTCSAKGWMACARVMYLHGAGFDTEVSLLKAELAMFSVSQF